MASGLPYGGGSAAPSSHGECVWGGCPPTLPHRGTGAVPLGERIRPPPHPPKPAQRGWMQTPAAFGRWSWRGSGSGQRSGVQRGCWLRWDGAEHPRGLGQKVPKRTGQGKKKLKITKPGRGWLNPERSWLERGTDSLQIRTRTAKRGDRVFSSTWKTNLGPRRAPGSAGAERASLPSGCTPRGSRSTPVPANPGACLRPAGLKTEPVACRGP